MKKRQADLSHLRDVYEATAETAKLAFMSSLSTWLQQSATSQKTFAACIGYSQTAVSQFRADPASVPEKFIRAVSTSIPDLADEYVRFRLTADAPFFKAVDGGHFSESSSRNMDRRAVLASVEEMSAKVIAAIEQLKREV